MGLILQLDDQSISAFKRNSIPFIIWGIFLTILGCVAISVATFSTIVSVIVLGFIIFFSGAIMLLDSFVYWWKRWRGFFIHFILALLYLGVGFMLIRNPLEGSVSLTLLLGIFYTLAGIFRLFFFSTTRLPTWGWGWFNGLITLLLGILILMNWPASSLIIIGLFVGIDLIFCGWAYIMAALAARSLANK